MPENNQQQSPILSTNFTSKPSTTSPSKQSIFKTPQFIFCLFGAILLVMAIISYQQSDKDTIPIKSLDEVSPIVINNVGYHFRFYTRKDNKYTLYFATAVEPDAMDELKVVTYSTYTLLKNGWLDNVKHPEKIELEAVFIDSKENSIDYSSIKPIKVPLKQFIDIGLQKYTIDDPNDINMSLQTSPDQKGEVISFEQDYEFDNPME